LDSALELIAKFPQVANVQDRFGATLLNAAARAGSEEMFDSLVSLGAKVNVDSLHAYDVLQYSASKGTPKMVEFALKSGLDPNHERQVFNATRNEKGFSKEILQLMLDNGLQINRVFAMFGDRNAAKTALDYVGEQSDIGLFLRTKGAKTAAEVLAENPNAEVLGADN
jgi:ankyrin repeat protein